MRTAAISLFESSSSQRRSNEDLEGPECSNYRVLKLPLVCDNVTETLTFTSTVTQNTYKINHQFNCSEKCLIYLHAINALNSILGKP